MADIIRAEQQDGRRVLHEDEHVIAFVPYFARYAYEVYVVPKRRVAHVFDLNDAEVASLAGALSAVTIRFDNLWRMSFPYVQVLHQAPTDGRRLRRVPFLHRVSSSAAPAPPAQVPGRARRSAAATSCPTPRRRQRPPSCARRRPLHYKRT